MAGALEAPGTGWRLRGASEGPPGTCAKAGGNELVCVLEGKRKAEGLGERLVGLVVELVLHRPPWGQWPALLPELT